MPKRPRSFGPSRYELGFSSLLMSTHSDGVARERAPGRRDKRPDLGRVLDAGRALDARGHIDAAGAAERDRGPDRAGVETAGQQPGNKGMKILREAPVERTAVAARQSRALRRLGVDQQHVGDALVSL